MMYRVHHADRRHLYRDSPLALKFELVEILRLHFPVLDGMSMLQKPVGERRFPVIDVGDDDEIPY